MKRLVMGGLRRARNLVWPTPPSHWKKSFSQQGEDVVLDCLFQGKTGGFYVDVGAHHPQRFSNTCLLHGRGWRGINIDATPGSMEPFRRLRPQDINLECGVSEQAKTLAFHLFNEPALNGFSAELSKERDGVGHFRLISTIPVPSRPLRELLAEHLPSGQRIDLLNVDVEGFDLEVLRSNDWTKYRPTIVIAEEILSFEIDGHFPQSPLVELMRGFDYAPCGKAVHSVFFVAREQIRYGADHGVHLGPITGQPGGSV